MNTSTVDLQRYLGNVTYPANKQDLIKTAKDHKAPQEVMSLLQGLPDKEYEDFTEISEEVNTRK